MRHFLFYFLVFLSLLQISRRIRDRFYPGTLKITFFDVGQGDSTLIQFPKGSNLLIDAGRGFRGWDVGTSVLARELKLRSVLTLDQVLLTHPDQDHSFGLRGIFSELWVKEFWINSDFLVHPDPVLKERLELADRQNTTLVGLSEPKLTWHEGVQTYYLPLHLGKKTNNRCLVTLFHFGKCRALLTGDIERGAEKDLLPFLEPVDLLKVAHHGSKTSSSLQFLQGVRPRVGVISAGIGNRYGHPHRIVLDRLRHFGAEVFRTDFHGMTEFESDGKEWKCRTTLGDCGSFQCGE